MNWKIILVDDDEYQLKILKSFFESKKYIVECANSKNDALLKIENFKPDLLLTDFAMPGGSGLDLVLEAKTIFPSLISVIMTSYGTIENAVDAIKRGVDNFLEKPINLDLLEIITNNLFENRKMAIENSMLKEKISDPLPQLIGSDPKITHVKELIAKASQYETNVLITGETGSGKEVAASLIWRASDRSNRPYLKINCASIPENLFESELFGYEKGAFTGAEKKKQGIIEECGNGTLLLDEIGDMPLSIQPKLLRFLESKEYYRVGSVKAQKSDVRIIFATRINLDEAVANKKFREDLYFRINVLNIELPPLRERKQDIIELFKHFFKIASRKFNIAEPKLDDSFAQKIISYEWPGNVRELINTVERILIFSKKDTITADDFNFIKTPGPSSNGTSNIFETFGATLTAATETLEKIYIENALKNSKNQTEAALKLGISERVLRYKMKNLNILT
ncbi:MAG: sigma-54 dependent transcriptional regulator [Candidatus Wallbacteria bacterium]